jgi:hypothetical protein
MNLALMEAAKATFSSAVIAENDFTNSLIVNSVKQVN